MDSLGNMRKRIGGVKSTNKITTAMKLVSVSKFKKAEELSSRASQFSDRLNILFEGIIRRVECVGFSSVNSRFFKRAGDSIKVLDIIFVTSDRGLCGGFSSTTIREVLRMKSDLEDDGKVVRLRCVGKKGVEYFRFNGVELLDSVVGLSGRLTYEEAGSFVSHAIDDYLAGLTDEVIVVHNGFNNMISQKLKKKVVLPFNYDVVRSPHADLPLNVEPEGDKDLILDELSRKYIECNMYHSILDSLSAEHCSRMQAMDSATNNLTSLVASLTKSYNKARQESITTELIEINAGAESMK